MQNSTDNSPLQAAQHAEQDRHHAVHLYAFKEMVARDCEQSYIFIKELCELRTGGKEIRKRLD
jgi:hypothetical protein